MPNAFAPICLWRCRISGHGGLVVNLLQDPGEPVGMDFRLARFRDQAGALARMTGCPLVVCRQELFIAEGDAVEAFMMLEQRHAALSVDEGRH